MRKIVRNELGNKLIYLSCILFENRNIYVEGRWGISDGVSEDIGRSVLSLVCVIEDFFMMVFNGVLFFRCDIFFGYSLSLLSLVLRFLF